MQKICQINGQQFEVSEKEQEFCRKVNLPLPEICPEERLRQLMATRNEWKLYRRKCDFSGEMILGDYDVGTPFPVYKNEIWWSDQWNALDYGRDFDFSRGFFEQFGELQKVVPREGTTVFNSENSGLGLKIGKILCEKCYLGSLE